MLQESHYYIKEDNLNELFTEFDVYINLTQENTIIPKEMDESVFNFLGYYKVYIELVPTPELENIPEVYWVMANKNIIDIIKINNTYIVKLQATFNESLVKYEWVKIREERDELLKTTDWIEASTLINQEDKKKIQAYRSYLRGITEFFKYPCDVVWITKPEIIVRKTEHIESEIDDVEFEQIKDFDDAIETKQWNHFLTEWSYTNFNKSKVLIDLLLKTYTIYTLNDILEYETLN